MIVCGVDLATAKICEFETLSIITFGKQAHFTKLNGKFMFSKRKIQILSIYSDS